MAKAFQVDTFQNDAFQVQDVFLASAAMGATVVVVDSAAVVRRGAITLAAVDGIAVTTAQRAARAAATLALPATGRAFQENAFQYNAFQKPNGINLTAQVTASERPAATTLDARETMGSGAGAAADRAAAQISARGGATGSGRATARVLLPAFGAQGAATSSGAKVLRAAAALSVPQGTRRAFQESAFQANAFQRGDGIDMASRADLVGRSAAVLAGAETLAATNPRLSGVAPATLAGRGGMVPANRQSATAPATLAARDGLVGAGNEASHAAAPALASAHAGVAQGAGIARSAAVLAQRDALGVAAVRKNAAAPATLAATGALAVPAVTAAKRAAATPAVAAAVSAANRSSRAATAAPVGASAGMTAPGKAILRALAAFAASGNVAGAGRMVRLAAFVAATTLATLGWFGVFAPAPLLDDPQRRLRNVITRVRSLRNNRHRGL